MALFELPHIHCKVKSELIFFKYNKFFLYVFQNEKYIKNILFSKLNENKRICGNRHRIQVKQRNSDIFVTSSSECFVCKTLVLLLKI